MRSAVGPPPPGATQGLGVTAFYCHPVWYTPRTVGCQHYRSPVYSLNCREQLFSETSELVKLPVWGRTGFDVSGQRLVRRAEFAGDSLNAGS